MHWNKIALIGVGLLGGSLGLALKQRRLAREIVGFVRRNASLAECEAKGAVDRATLDLKTAVDGAELIVLCTPIAQMLPLAEQMRPFISAEAIVTDVGSVKGSVVQELEPALAGSRAHFIGSHPMAGAEKTGVGAAQANLFVGAICVVTPSAQPDAVALGKVERLWESVGGRLLRLSPAMHDELVSRSSHLPHVLAAALTNLVLSRAHPAEQAALCANGFRDTTRIASGSPEMWRDIALANGDNLSRALTRLVADLEKFAESLERKDSEAISRFFETAKHQRDAWSARVPSPSPE